jgi:cytoskeletal protein CcmA (bactofilin family)
MFKNDNHGAAETIIGPSVQVEGDLSSQGNIQVEGALTGTILTAGNLMVGEQAKLMANVEVANAYIAGYLKGNLTVHERLELAPTSKIDGDIMTKTLVIAEGAQLNGRCLMGSAAVPATTSRGSGNKKTPAAE